MLYVAQASMIIIHIGMTLLYQRGAGSGDFGTGEQEFLLEFDKYKNPTKNRNSKYIFLLKILFLVKIGTYYHGCRRPFNSLQWKKLSNLFWSRELYNIE